MRSGAAAVLKLLQGVHRSKPVVLLLGHPEVRRHVCQRLGSSTEAQPEQVTAHILPNLVLVEPPDLLGPSEVTELATFLRGLQEAHALLICEEPGSCPELAQMLASFYGFSGEILDFLAIATINGNKFSGEQVVMARYFLEDSSDTSPCVFNFGDDLGLEIDVKVQLTEWLSGRTGQFCEPLRCDSELLLQYRGIRQQLGQRKPSISGSPSPVSSTPSAPTSMQEVPLKRNFTLMVFGKTGAGKSHLANLILGFPAFDAGDSLASVTSQESVRKATSADGHLVVLDTIGFGDTRLPPEAVVRSLRDTALEAADGVDVLLFVMKKERMTVAEQETLAYVTQLLFGPECLPNLYMVITHAGRLAKAVDRQEAWLQEQVAASSHFAAMIALLGTEPLSRLLFVENPNLAEAEEDERELAEKRRKRALQDVYAVLQRHKAPPFRHSIMRRAGELQAAHLESLRQELKKKLEVELQVQLDKDRGALEAERLRLQEEVEEQRKELREQEEEIRRRFEHEWSRMHMDFIERAKTMARQDLEHMAKDIVDQTEKKVEEQTGAKRGRRCELM